MAWYRWLVVDKEFETVESRHRDLARARAACMKRGTKRTFIQDSTLITCRACGESQAPGIGDRLRVNLCPACFAGRNEQEV